MASGTALAAASLHSQLGFTWESQSPEQAAAISDYFTAYAGWPRQNTGGTPRACAPSGQLQTTSEHHLPTPAQLIIHGGRRLVVRGHSQSLQLTGLDKSLPLICQQQPNLNYKRRVYSAHTEGTPQIPSLGDYGRLCHWILQDTCDIRRHHQDRES